MLFLAWLLLGDILQCGSICHRFASRLSDAAVSCVVWSSSCHTECHSADLLMLTTEMLPGCGGGFLWVWHTSGLGLLPFYVPNVCPQTSFPLDFTERSFFVDQCGHSPVKTLYMGRYLLEMSLMDYSMAFESDSRVAAACLYIARRMLAEEPWVL